MSKDKVESRTDVHLKRVLAVIDKSDHPDRGELRGIVKAVFEQAAALPSVPVQGQALFTLSPPTQIMIDILQEWSASALGIDIPETSYEEAISRGAHVIELAALAASRSQGQRLNYDEAKSTARKILYRNGVNQPIASLLDELAVELASRSEAQPPQSHGKVIRCLRCKEVISYRCIGNDVAIDHQCGAPAAGLMPSCTACGAIMRGVCPECNNTTGISPAAGSAERWIPVSEKLPEFTGQWWDRETLGQHTENVLVLQGEVQHIADYAQLGDAAGVWATDEGKTLKAVTHWRPLPESPLAGTQRAEEG